MYTSDRIRSASRALRANIARTLLTVLGIVIGITAIILVMSIGDGAESLILGQIEGLGSRTIIIEPGREPQGPSDFSEVYTDSLKDRDLVAIEDEANVQGLTDTAPLIIQVVTVSHDDESKRLTVYGTSERFTDIMDIRAEDGVLISEDDVRRDASVAILGSDVRKDLFGESDAVGETVKIKDRTYTVIGTVESKGQVGFLDVDGMVVVPYTTAQQYISGTSHFSAIFARADHEDNVPRITRDIELTLREMHGIDDPEKDDFHVTTQADATEMVQLITSILTALLASVAAISLIVGGIGIMNIMLVTVSERTREIGLRKALGATDGDVLTQFLFESVILTGLGGGIGILLGAGLSFLVSVVLSQALDVEWVFTFPVSAALLGLGVSSAIGLIFGLYPARQAAKKSPIEALRNE